MGQSTSTLSQNTPQSFSSSPQLQANNSSFPKNSNNVASSFQRIHETQSSQYQTAPGTNNSHLQSNISTTNIRNLDRNILVHGNYQSEITSTLRNRAYNPTKHSNLVKRRNSEDFDASLMEENPEKLKESKNLSDSFNNIGPSSLPKRGTDDNKVSSQLLRAEGKNEQKSKENKKISDKKFGLGIENKRTVGNSPQNTFEQQRGVLTVKKTNILNEDTEVREDENVTMRKHTFGIENNNTSGVNDFIIHSPEIVPENRLLQSDEVRIMETGYSSSRKRHSERENYEQYLLESHKFQESTKKSYKNSLLESYKSKGPNSSAKSFSKQKPFLRRPDDLPTCKASQNEEKKAICDIVIEDSQNLSPVQTRKNGQGSFKNMGGFPNVEFSFKPNTLQKENGFNSELASSRGNSSCKKPNNPSQQSARRSKSQMKKPRLPPIEILESGSSSFADGPMSTGAVSSPSSQNLRSSKNNKVRNHSAIQTRTSRSRYNTRATDGSFNNGQIPYNTKNHLDFNGFPAQTYHPILPTPLMHTGAPLGTMPVVPSMEAYQYLNHQNPYYGNANYAYSLPASNHPYYYPNYQVPPHMSPITYNVYHGGAQPPSNNFVHNYTTPYSNHPSHIVPNLTINGRDTPLHERLYSVERGSDSLRNFSKQQLRTEEGSLNSYKNLPQTQEGKYEKHEYQNLRASKSLKNLRAATVTPDGDLRSNRIKMAKEDKKNEGNRYKNQSFAHTKPSNKVTSIVKEADQYSQNLRGKENVDQMGKIGKVRHFSNINAATKALNDTTISRINEVSNRTRKPIVCQDESRGTNELDRTGHSLVQKLEGGSRENCVNGISNMNSIENNEESQDKYYENSTKRGQKVPENMGMRKKVASNNENEGRKIERTGEIKILAGRNEPLSKDIQNLISNPTSNLSNKNVDEKNQALFNEIKKRLACDKTKAQKEEKVPELRPVQKAVKLCFNFDEGDDLRTQIRKSNGEDKSLADFFRQRKQNLVHKLEEENKRFSTSVHNTTKEIDKSELIQRRRDMLKSNKKGQNVDTMSSSGFPRDFSRTPDLSQIGLSGFPPSPIEGRKNTDMTVISGYTNMLSHNGSRRNTRELNASLMERLAQGQKQKLSKKEMVALTAKNYKNLPEVKSKINDLKKKEDKMKELKERQGKVKDLDARLRRTKSAKRINTSDSRSYYLA